MRFFDKVSTQLMSPSRTVLWLFDISCRKSTCEPIVTQTRALEVLLSIIQYLKSLISCILSNIASSFKGFVRDCLNHFFSQTQREKKMRASTQALGDLPFVPQPIHGPPGGLPKSTAFGWAFCGKHRAIGSSCPRGDVLYRGELLGAHQLPWSIFCYIKR